MTHINGNCLMN